MKKFNFIQIAFIFTGILFFAGQSFSQTSWKGTTSTTWSTASNWTSGVPTASMDAIIGDANFAGTNQPSITGLHCAGRSPGSKRGTVFWSVISE